MDIIQINPGRKANKRLSVDATDIEGVKHVLTNGHPWTFVELGKVHHQTAPITVLGTPCMDMGRCLDAPFDDINTYANLVVSEGDGYSIGKQLSVADGIAYAVMTDGDGNLLDFEVRPAGCDWGDTEEIAS